MKNYTFIKILLVVFVLFFALPQNMIARRGPIAILSTNKDGKTRTLTFTIGDIPSKPATSSEDGVYKVELDLFQKSDISRKPNWNSGEDRGGNWLYNDTGITKVIIDPSFRNVRPESTYGWFANIGTQETPATIEGLENLNTSYVTDMGDMFMGSIIKGLNLKLLNTKNVKSMHSMFEEMLTEEQELNLNSLNTSNVTDMSRMFAYNGVPIIHLDSLNTSNVKKMGYMFGCSKVRHLDLSNFDFSNVSDVDGMFLYCQNLEDIIFSNVTMPKVKNTVNMFSYCHKLKSIKFGTFDASNVTDMQSMFEYCDSLEVLDLSGFKADSLKNTSRMFFGCQNIANIDVSGLNAENIENMSGMFANCTSLKGIDFSKTHFKNIPDMSSLFYNCSNLTEIKFSDLEDSSVGKIDSIFQNCKSLSELDVSHIKPSNSDQNAFKGCSSLKKLNVSSWDTSISLAGCTSLIELTVGNKLKGGSFYGVGTIEKPCRLNIGDQFDKRVLMGVIDKSNGCHKWGGGYFYIPNEEFIPVAILSAKDRYNDEAKLTFTYADESLTKIRGRFDPIYVYTLNAQKDTLTKYPEWYSQKITEIDIDKSFSDVKPYTIYHWFSELKNLDTISGLKYLNTTNITSMDELFYNCKKLRSIDLSGFNTANVTSMKSMFQNCNKLKEMDLSHFNTANVTSMAYMFQNCNELKEMDLSHFNTANVTSMAYMFQNCNMIKKLDLSSFNTQKVEDMSNMFFGCDSLVSCNVRSFDTRNVKNMEKMFAHCSSLDSIDISNFNTQQITNNKEMFSYCYKLSCLNIGNFTLRNIDYFHNGMYSVGYDKPCELLYDYKFDKSLLEKESYDTYKFQGGIFRIRRINMTLGDSNHDKDVDVADVTNINKYLLFDTPDVFDEDASDANKDGHISVSDIPATIDIIMSQGTTENSVSRAKSAYGSVPYSGLVYTLESSKRLAVTLDDADMYNAVQVDIVLPETCGDVNFNLDNSISTTHKLVARRNGNKIRVAVYSLTNKPLATGMPVFYVNLPKSVDVGSITIKNAKAADNNAVSYCLGTRFEDAVTSIDNINSDNHRLSVYNGCLSIEGYNGSDYTITTIGGAICKQGTVTGNNLKVYLQKGVYIVRISGATYKFIVK